jgi:hypothetical protein
MIEYHICQMNIQAAILTLQGCLEQDEFCLSSEAYDDEEAKEARQRVRKMKRFTQELTEILEAIDREMAKEQDNERVPD